ncbi:MAG: sigma 54-interacting transcriptional regulator [Lachnospiraceae bacterium]|nr:sigma 54-interacting transcriptional regulator [Lachnospiraceae bacterium]
MTHILFFAPYPNCISTIEEVLKERSQKNQFTYEVLLDQFDNKLESIYADTIIARGFTAQSMRKLDIPCAELKISGYDVIAAFIKCIKLYHKKKIALVGARNMFYDSENIASMYPEITLIPHFTDRESDLESCVLQAKQEGAEVLMGGFSSCEFAKKHGIPNVLIESGKKAIDEAIDNALSTLAVYHRERQRSNEFSNIMNYSFQGILSTDTKGIITFTNKQCYKILAGLDSPLIGRRITDIFQEFPIERIIQKKENIVSEIHKYKDRLLAFNGLYVSSKEYVSGCVVTFQDISAIQKEEEKIRTKIHKQGFVAKYNFSNIKTDSSVTKRVIETAREYGATDLNILIHGETGVGKELFAQSIHNASPRKNGPFVAINCAAISEDLLESELFGYVEGAFTGAAKGGKMGFFEIAHKGTIFLDEIGDISKKLQSRLLRVIQEREIIRLGNDTVIPIDVRILSATNKDLMEEVEEGNFRRDLLYRLDVLELNIPALRERGADSVFLSKDFIRFNHESKGDVLEGLSREAEEMMLHYSWPGNIRELQNFCQRLCIISKGKLATREDVRLALPGLLDAKMQQKRDAIPPIQETEKETIIRALKENGGSRTKTAAFLQVDKSTLWRKMKKYDLLSGNRLHPAIASDTKKTENCF